VIPLKLGHDQKKEFIKESGSECSNVNCTSRKKLTIDHIIPLSEGGGHELENLRVLCWACHEWLNKHGELPYDMVRVIAWAKERDSKKKGPKKKSKPIVQDERLEWFYTSK